MHRMHVEHIPKAYRTYRMWPDFSFPESQTENFVLYEIFCKLAEALPKYLRSSRRHIKHPEIDSECWAMPIRLELQLGYMWLRFKSGWPTYTKILKRLLYAASSRHLSLSWISSACWRWAEVITILEGQGKGLCADTVFFSPTFALYAPSDLRLCLCGPSQGNSFSFSESW